MIFLRLRVLLVLVGLLAAGGTWCVAQSVDGPTPGLGETLQDYRALKLASEGVSVEQREATIGHLRFQLKNGVAYPLVSRQGETLGFYYEGGGIYEYTSEDVADRQLIESNLEAATKASIYRDYKVRDSIEQVIVFFARPTLEALWGSAAPGGGGVTLSGDARKNFEKLWAATLKTSLEYDHLAAEARLNGSQQQYIYAEILGRKENVGYSYDSVRRFRERLFTFRKFSGYDLRFRVPASTQPVAGGLNAQLPPLSLEHADFDIATRDNETATIRYDLTLRVQRDDVRAAHFQLLNHRDPNAYDWSSEVNRLRLTSVTDEQGNPVEFSHRHHEVLVQLPEPVARGETVHLVFESRGEILTGITSERHDRYFELFTDRWFPDPSDWARSQLTFTLQVKTRKPYRPIATGRIVSFAEEGEAYVLRTESKIPVGHIAVFAGKYHTREKQFDDLTIRVHDYATSRKGVMEKMPDLAHAFITFFESVLGPFPFDELDIVEVPEYGFGIAPAGMVLLTSEAYNPRQDYLASYFSRGINSRLAHEIAHQWFGHQAGPASSRDTWLSESFAEYMSYLAMAAMQGKNRQVEGYQEQFNDWWRGARLAAGSGPIVSANELSGPSAGAHRFYLLYCRGPLVLRMMHTLLGNERFFAIVRRFLEEADMGMVTTADLQRVTEEVLGSDMSWFFDQWIDTGGIPEVRVDHRLEQADGGKTLLTGTASLESGEGFYRLYIPLIVNFGKDQKEVRMVKLENGQTEFRFELPSRPKSVSVDPVHNTLTDYR